LRRSRQLACAALCIVLAPLVLASSAAADDPVPPVRAAAPRAVPVARGPVSSTFAPNFATLVAHAVGAANDLTVLSQLAGQVASEQRRVSTDLASAKAAALPVALPPELRDETGEPRDARLSLEAQLAALTAEENALEGTAAFRLRAADASTLRWLAPARGEVSQGFGPTDVWAEPGRTVDGVWYPHYHDGLDIAAPMYAPVTAAAPGQVVFVGHLADGAEIVLIAHVGGWVSEYGHLDDGTAPPTVVAGDVVTTGQVIGHIGMTGNTSGPHLHFEVWRNGYLVDPMALLLRPLPAPARERAIDGPTRD
jgi:murein DD-endopeptidase MepM/ murein hydrolase activator NlpD